MNTQKQSSASAMLIPLAAFIAVNVLAYLSFAFILWELNAANWNELARAIVVGLGLGCGVCAAAAVSQ